MFMLITTAQYVKKLGAATFPVPVFQIRFIPCIPLIPVKFGLYQSFFHRDAGDSGDTAKTENCRLL
jgi:hypothetical protein